MTKQEGGGLFRAFTGWVEKRLNGTGFVIVQTSNPRKLEDAMEVARFAGGWVEKDGETAHVADGTEVDPSKIRRGE